MTVVDPRKGPDDMGMARRIGKRSFRDPYPVSKDHFLVADDGGIHLLDQSADVETLFKPSQSGLRWACHEPRPLRVRQREVILPDRTDPSVSTVVFFSPIFTSVETWMVLKKGR